MVRAEEAEAAVVEYLSAIRLPEDWQQRILALTHASAVEVERIEAERERLEDRLERAQHLYLLGDVSREEYSNLRDEVKRKLNVLKPTQEPDLEEAARLLEDIGTLLQQATPEELKEVFNALLESVYLDSGEAGPVIAVEPRPFVRERRRSPSRCALQADSRNGSCAGCKV
jgi:hypothetical protein